MNKVFLTGGNGDIGSSIKKIFLKNGYDVTAPSSNELNLLNQADITKYFTLNKDFDIFIHCAGFNEPKSFSDISQQDIEIASKINYLSFIQITKILSNYMINQHYGKIVAISSLYGQVSRKGRLAYSLSKHALNACVKTLACELGKDNILVNCVSPGFVDTKLTRKNNTQNMIDSMCKRIPLNRLAKADDISNVVYFLCSDKNTYINGQDIIVDGGYMAGGNQEL